MIRLTDSNDCLICSRLSKDASAAAHTKREHRLISRMADSFQYDSAKYDQLFFAIKNRQGFDELSLPANKKYWAYELTLL
jgi:hypothetical protein